MNAQALVAVDPSGFAARRDQIRALAAASRAATGHDTLGEAIWRDLEHPGPDSAGFLDDARAYAHVARLVAGGHERSWSAGVVEAPDVRASRALATVLAAVADHVRNRGGGDIVCWLPGASDSDDARFAEAGWRRTREQYEMRVDLPLGERPRWPAGVSVRTFDAERDATAWLEVNNRAFAAHPEQGGWLPETLRGRMAEPWFDPALFLLAFDAGGLAGFNWLKLHEPADPDPALGEIYVIGVDPHAQGTGLGRALAVAGLEAVHARGVSTGSLFCASDNAGALALYRALGFRVHRTDRAYEYGVAPRGVDPA